MSNIFADYVSILDWSAYDILAAVESLFNKLDINISEYEDNFQCSDWDSDSLRETLCKILLYKAQEEEIIPETADIDECFKTYGDLAIKSSEFDTDICEQIVKDFEDWCGIKLDIIWN